MDQRALRVGCVALGLLLFALVLYQPAFFDLEADRSHTTWVESDSTPAYEERLDRIDDAGASEADLDVVRYEDLSPQARRFVDRALAQPPDESGTHEYDPTVCAPHALGCPHLSRADVPPELAYEIPSAPTDAALLVETDDDRYLVSTRGVVAGAITGNPVGDSPEYLVRIAVLVPFATLLVVQGAGRREPLGHLLVVAYAALFAWLAIDAGYPWASIGALLPWLVPGLLAPATDDDRVLAASLGVGGLLAALALAPSYLAAYAGVPAYTGPRLLAGAVASWCGGAVILLAVLRERRGDDRDSERDGKRATP